jgi:hypothetical protein
MPYISYLGITNIKALLNDITANNRVPPRHLEEGDDLLGLARKEYLDSMHLG